MNMIKIANLVMEGYGDQNATTKNGRVKVQHNLTKLLKCSIV